MVVSPNEQDQRYLGKMHSIPVLEPATAEEASAMTRYAFTLSEECGLPVILRTTPQVAHTRGVIEVGEIGGREEPPDFERRPAQLTPIPVNARRMRIELEKRLADAEKLLAESPFFERRGSGGLGVLAAGAPVAPLLDQIEELAEERGEGKELRVTVDSALTWPWAWYLRDYQNVDYPDLSAMSQPPAGTVLLLSADNEQAAQPYLDKYGEGREFHQLLWFPEEYRGRRFADADSWRWWWDYLLERETEGPYWTTEGIAYFPGSSP